MEIIELCTGDQKTEKELKKYLAEHPEEHQDIFETDLDNIKF